MPLLSTSAGRVAAGHYPRRYRPRPPVMRPLEIAPLSAIARADYRDEAAVARNRIARIIAT